MVYFNFIHKWQELQFKVDSERQILRNFSWQFYIQSEFLPEILWEEIAEEDILCVFCLLDEKPGFESQARHQNKIRKVFPWRFPLSRFLAKTLRVNKNCHEVSQNIYRSESTLNCRFRHLCIKITHTTYVVGETRSIILTWRVVMTNYACMYVCMYFVLMSGLGAQTLALRLMSQHTTY